MDRFSRFSRAGLGAALMRVKAVAGLALRRYFHARITYIKRDLVFMSKHVVATVSEIPPGQRKLVTVRGRSIAVFNLDGEFHGLFNRCPHQGGPMCEGILTGLIQSSEPGRYDYSRPGEIIRCPWHGWEFDVKTGQSFCDPSKISVRNFPIEVVPGTAVVQGPYVAETLPVTVEEQYVIVEMA
jgi:nitrite reductase/ring-hydroxylating ferredoxin subunit